MYTSDIDWSPSVKLGHNKVDENKLQEAQHKDQMPSKESMKKLLTNAERWAWKTGAH